jgi:hypothetical protein
MATDFARYMVENPDVYDMFRKPGSGRPNWTWDNGRKAGQYRRNDGTMTKNTTAAEYAQQHYNNFGKREGRQLHERTSDAYEIKIREIDGGGGGGGGMNAELAQMIEDLAAIAMDTNATPEEREEALEQSKTILTNFDLEESKKKKSFLTPIGGD